MKRIAIIAAVVALAGCASHSVVAPMGKGKFLLTKQAATGFPGLGNMKAELLVEAGAHCRAQGGELEVIKASETAPPYVFGNYPRVDLEFSCS